MYVYIYIYIHVWIYIFFIIMDTWICEDLVKNRAQNGPKSFKIEVWGSLGALWEPSWRPSGAGATTRAQKVEKYAIFGSPRSSKMDQKSIQNRIKNYMIFHIEFRTTFSRYWEDFGSQNLSKMRGLRVAFSTSLRICEKCDFERQYSVFAIFFDFGSVDFWPERVYFSSVFSNAILRPTFLEFGWNFGPNWTRNRSPNWWKKLWKSKLKFWWFFNEF